MLFLDGHDPSLQLHAAAHLHLGRGQDDQTEQSSTATPRSRVSALRPRIRPRIDASAVISVRLLRARLCSRPFSLHLLSLPRTMPAASAHHTLPPYQPPQPLISQRGPNATSKYKRKKIRPSCRRAAPPHGYPASPTRFARNSLGFMLSYLHPRYHPDDSLVSYPQQSAEAILAGSFYSIASSVCACPTWLEISFLRSGSD
ncbi:hypothetical protein DFH27DRAFT_230036 [Peziza echinospora]|nr:hypothetical protein DFH27DRAFT_230036 [Peziza echinospora]